MALCEQIAGKCRCKGDPGHDGPHECRDEEMCDGAWSGSEAGDDFKIVRLPRPFRGTYLEAMVDG